MSEQKTAVRVCDCGHTTDQHDYWHGLYRGCTSLGCKCPLFRVQMLPLSVSRAPQEQDGSMASAEYQNKAARLPAEGALTTAPIEPSCSSGRAPAEPLDLEACKRLIDADYVVLPMFRSMARNLLAEVERLTAERNDHGACHDLVCNGDRTKPRGAKGVTCSCRYREERAAAENAQLMSDKAKLLAECAILTAEQERLRSAVKEQAQMWREVGDNYSAIQYEHAAALLERLLREALAPLSTTPQEQK